MGYKHRHEDILTAAVQASIEDGMGSLSYRRLAKRLGIPDRTIVYYFPTKEALIEAVLEAHATQLQAILLEAFGRPARDSMDLLRMAWPVVACPNADPVFRVFFEITGLAVRGVAPFDRLVPESLEAWIAMLMPLLDVPPSKKRAEAEATLATVDGLLLMRQLMGPAAAERAATRLGITAGR
ncbi:MAG: TetR/AcrR family transcriptional regulator [Myxococcota bacterium]